MSSLHDLILSNNLSNRRTGTPQKVQSPHHRAVFHRKPLPSLQNWFHDGHPLANLRPPRVVTQIIEKKNPLSRQNRGPKGSEHFTEQNLSPTDNQRTMTKKNRHSTFDQNMPTCQQPRASCGAVIFDQANGSSILRSLLMLLMLLRAAVRWVKEMLAGMPRVITAQTRALSVMFLKCTNRTNFARAVFHSFNSPFNATYLGTTAAPARLQLQQHCAKVRQVDKYLANRQFQ